MATKVQSYCSRRFAECDCWTQTSVAGNAATADSNKSRCEKKQTMWKLKRNIAANEFYTVWKETLLPTKRIIGTVAVNVGHFLVV